MTKTNPKLVADVRTMTGKKVKTLRKQGILPATIYGFEMEPISIQMAAKAMTEVFAETGESGLVELMIGDKKYPVIFRNPQYHPMTADLIHVDCYKVNLKEKITATVPLEFVGEAPAVKNGLVLVEVTTEVEVEALPNDLPQNIEVDISKLENLESMILISDLIVDKSKVEIKNSADLVIVKVEEQKVEEEPVAEEAVAPGDVPATQQKSPEEIAAADAKAAEEKKKEKD